MTNQKSRIRTTPHRAKKTKQNNNNNKNRKFDGCKVPDSASPEAFENLPSETMYKVIKK